VNLERFNFIKRIIVKKRLERVSEISMKDLILESNKEDVIKYAKHFLKEKDPGEKYIEDLIKSTHNNNSLYKCPIYNELYLEKKLDEISLLAKKKFIKDTSKYKIESLFPFSGSPWGFDEFLSLIEIDTNCEVTYTLILMKISFQ